MMSQPLIQLLFVCFFSKSTKVHICYLGIILGKSNEPQRLGNGEEKEKALNMGIFFVK